MRKTWDVIKEVICRAKGHTKTTQLLINNRISEDPVEIAENFNDYFSNVGSNLAKNFPSDNAEFSQYLKGSFMQSMVLKSVTQEEIRKIVLNLKNGAPGHDGIRADTLKSIIDYIINPLTHISELSIMQGYFPHELKLAKVIPIFKSGDSTLCKNYRPISLLSVFSKILEKLMYDRLNNYLNKQAILYTYQFGFQKNKSTHMALICLMDKLVTALDSGEFAIGIYMDFSKAFDTVDIDILLQKLYFYGIRGPAYDWFLSYLSGRKQYVACNSVNSSTRSIHFGVPQGSNLGPLLFLIYINDLAYVSSRLFSILFADDSNFFLTGTNPDTMIRIINEDMHYIVAWLRANKLTLNVDKTHFMLFSPSRKKYEISENVVIQNSTIEHVHFTKFLGVIIDSNLSWKNHISYISSKIAKNIGVLCRGRKIFNNETMLSLYNALILPYLTYCIHIWGSAYKTYINQLVLLQKRAIRLIAGVPHRTHTKELFHTYNILPVENLYKYTIALFIYKLHHNILPDFGFNLIYMSDIHNYITRNCNCIQIPRFHTEFGKRSFNYSAIIMWNEIVSVINCNSTIGSFKNSLRKYLSAD